VPATYQTTVEQALEIEFIDGYDGKLDLVQDVSGELGDGTAGTHINFEFYFALNIVELLAEGFEELSFTIRPESATPTYSYFTGGIQDMTDSITDYFINQMVPDPYSPGGGNNDLFESYYYDKKSLTKFVSDEVLTRMGRVKSRIEIGDGDVRNTSAVPADYENIKYEFSYLEEGPVQEPLVTIKFARKWGAIRSGLPFKYLFRDTAGTYSISPGDIGDVVYPRSTVNAGFKGTTSPDPKRLMIGDSSKPASFWSMWKEFFSYSLTSPAFLPTVKAGNASKWPCKISGSIFFKDTPLGNQAMLGFILQDTVILEIKILGEQKTTGTVIKTYAPVQRPISILDLLARSEISAKKATVSAIRNFDHDFITVTNPNNHSILVAGFVFHWDDSVRRLAVDPVSLVATTIPARSSFSFSETGAATYASRFYQFKQCHGIYEEMGVLDPMSDVSGAFWHNVAWITLSAVVPGVANIVNPSLSDPSLQLYRRGGDGSRLGLNVANVPPYVDQIRYYIKPVQSSGFGAQRHSGSSRSDHAFIGYEPVINPTSAHVFPLGEYTINYTGLFPGLYEFVADLYRNGSRIDSVTGFHRKIWDSPAQTQGIAFHLESSVASSQAGDSITIIERGAEKVESVSRLVETLVAGDVPSEYSAVFAETVADKTVMSTYKVSRLNIETNVVEELGWQSPGVQAFYLSTDQTTPTRIYQVKQYVATIGQMISTMQPTMATPLWHVGAGGGMNIVFDYAKFKSSWYLKEQLIPTVEYSISPTGTGSPWPRIMWPLPGYTGVCQSAYISTSTLGVSHIDNFIVEYDPLRKVNVLSWTITAQPAVNSEKAPIYWMITADYGGVSSLVGQHITLGLSETSCIDRVLAGALGTVIYKLHVLHNDGTKDYLNYCSMEHDDDRGYMEILGTGL
jgi:hypothetical protein